MFGREMVYEPEMAYDDKQKNEAKERKLKDLKKFVRPTIQQKTEAQMSDMQHEVIQRCIERNTFHIVPVELIDGEYMSGVPIRCLGLANHYFIAIDHYYHTFNKLTNCEFWYIQDNIKLHLPNFKDIMANSKQFNNSALVISKLPRIIPPFKNILKFIMLEKHAQYIPSKAMIIEVDRTDKQIKTIIHNDRIKLIRNDIKIPPLVEGYDSTVVENVLEYKLSGKGKCGSVIVSDTSQVGSIIGIHVAGVVNSNIGFGELIVRETFLDFIQQCDDVIMDVADYMIYKGEKLIVGQQADPVPYIDGVVQYIGTTSNKFSHNSPKKSTQKHTLCYNKITNSTYDFPILSSSDSRAIECPLVSGCEHHGEPTKNFDNYDLNVASDSVQVKILANCLPVKQVSVLSVEEAIVGFEHIPQYAPMELSTSEGFPFKSDRPAGAFDKRWLIHLNLDNYPKVTFIDPSVLEVMRIKHNLRKKGVVPFTVFIDCLKDLKLPKEKPNARIFSISPIDFTIQFRQYFYDFCIAYQDSRFEVESAIGIDAESVEWSKMIYRLVDMNDKFVCGDYSKFGPRLNALCVMKAFDIIIEWYKFNGDDNAENNLVRLVMAYEIAFSKHLMKNFLYSTFCGAPSGSPITTILNNLVNCIYIRVAFSVIMSKYFNKVLLDHKLINSELVYENKYMSDFEKNVRLICYGDDEIMTVSDDCIEIFNAKTMSYFFSIYWIKFTDARKTGNIQNYTTLFDLNTSFLKRVTVPHECRPFIYVSRMDQRSVEEICNWMYKSEDEIEMSKIACQAMLISAYGHGRVYYNELRSKVFRFWAEMNEYIVIPSWEEVDNRIFG